MEDLQMPAMGTKYVKEQQFSLQPVSHQIQVHAFQSSKDLQSAVARHHSSHSQAPASGPQTKQELIRA